jgi:hypothetical protein
MIDKTIIFLVELTLQKNLTLGYGVEEPILCWDFGRSSYISNDLVYNKTKSVSNTHVMVSIYCK